MTNQTVLHASRKKTRVKLVKTLKQAAGNHLIQTSVVKDQNKEWMIQAICSTPHHWMST